MRLALSEAPARDWLVHSRPVGGQGWRLVQLGDPSEARAAAWGLEARWTPSRASCMSGARVEDLIAKGRSPDCNGDGDHKRDFADCYKVMTPWLITSTCKDCRVPK